MRAMTLHTDFAVRTKGFVTEAECRRQTECLESTPAVFKAAKANESVSIEPSKLQNTLQCHFYSFKLLDKGNKANTA